MYGELPYHPGYSSSPGIVSLYVPCPPYLCHAACIRSVPSPVLLTCTYSLPSVWSVPSLSSHHAHIFKPHTNMNPSTVSRQNPTYKLCSFIISNKTNIQQQCNSNTSRLMYPPCLQVGTGRFLRPRLTKVAPFPFIT